jgi:hypothetical protein
MKLNYSFIYILPIVLILSADNMIIELTAPHNPSGMARNLSMILKGTAGIAFLYSAFYFMRMSTFMRVAFVLLTTYVFALSFESKYFYNSFMVYPHVFQKVLVFYNIFFIYTFYRGDNPFKFSHMVYFILIVFLLNVVFINPHAVSISSFTNHERGLWSSSVYMMVFPFFYFLSKYFYKGGIFNLGLTFFCLLCIFFFQHRSIWITTAVMLVVYYLLIKFKAQEKINFVGKLMPVATVGVIIGIASSAFLFSMHPEILDKVAESISDIQNYDKQGTGGWRMTQINSYLPFVYDNFVFGMRFEGFELPIQFYRDDIDQPVFEDGNGHFFHNFYLEVFFYMGLIGMILFLIPALYAVIKGLTMKSLTTNQIILHSLVVGAFILGLSYVLPTFFHGFLGLCIALLEKGNAHRHSYLPEFANRIRQRRISQQGQLTI